MRGRRVARDLRQLPIHLQSDFLDELAQHVLDAEVAEEAHPDDEPDHGRWKQLALPLSLAAVFRYGLLDQVAWQDLSQGSGPERGLGEISDSSASCWLVRIGTSSDRGRRRVTRSE